jgi:hypothetical protein
MEREQIPSDLFGLILSSNIHRQLLTAAANMTHVKSSAYVGFLSAVVSEKVFETTWRLWKV